MADEKYDVNDSPNRIVVRTYPRGKYEHKTKALPEYGKNDRVFVRNLLKMDYALPVGTPDNRDNVIYFHQTFIPICLSDFVPTGMLKTSTSLLTAIRRGILELVPEEDAEEILSTEDAKREVERLHAIDSIAVHAETDDAPILSPIEAMQEAMYDDIDRDLKAIIFADYSEDRKLQNLMTYSLRNDLTTRDLQFIQSVMSSSSECYKFAEANMRKNGKIVR